MRWTAVYSGIMLEEGMKTDGVLGVDVLWGSVVVFPHDEGMRVAVSTFEDVASTIVGVLEGGGGSDGKEEIYTSAFTASLNDIVGVVEKLLDKEVDRYEGDFEGARKEAQERMKRGYFDGGVALMGRVAVWDAEVGAWEKWQEKGEVKDWAEKVVEVARKVRNGDLGGDGCGC